MVEYPEKTPAYPKSLTIFSHALSRAVSDERNMVHKMCWYFDWVSLHQLKRLHLQQMVNDVWVLNSADDYKSPQLLSSKHRINVMKPIYHT